MADAGYVPLEKEPWWPRTWRFVRALIVGGAATLSDVTVYTLSFRLIGLTQEHARLPALLVGALVQFFGNRGFTFKANAGALDRHSKLFLALEAPAYLANYLIFKKLVKVVTFLPPELVTFLGTFLVFAFYSYPLRRLVIFRVRKEEAASRALLTQEPADHPAP